MNLQQVLPKDLMRYRLGYTLGDNGYGVISGINFFAGSEIVQIILGPST